MKIENVKGPRALHFCGLYDKGVSPRRVTPRLDLALLGAD